MAYLKSKTLFFTTSPRTPLKMIPEIEVLEKYFEGELWNKDTQIEFIKNWLMERIFKVKVLQRSWHLARVTVLIVHLRLWDLLT